MHQRGRQGNFRTLGHKALKAVPGLDYSKNEKKKALVTF